MSQEIEMKLALGRDGPEQLCRHPLLQGQPGVTQRLANTYYDTPEGELEAARMALRLRQCDDTWVQTLKTSGQGSGGLSRRGEWEWPVSEGVLDREGLSALPPMAGLGAEVLGRLEARFTTDFERRLWQLEHGDATIEVALDQGEIRSAGRAVPIRELELELKAGDPAALWGLAMALAETIPLRPADASKAARGGALLTGHWSLPEGTADDAQLHRALLALDAFEDTGEDSWMTTARATWRDLASRGHREAGRLDEMLARPGWMNAEFGRTALGLAHRLAP